MAAGFIFFITQNTVLVFLPLFPLLLLGLYCGAKQEALALASACATTAVFSGLPDGVVFALLLGLPALFFTKRALLWRGEEGARDWYPMLRILAELTIIASFCIMLISFWSTGQGGLKGTMPQGLGDGFKDADPDFVAMVQAFTTDWSFTFFALMGWLWVMMFYAFGVLANAVLSWKDHALRPSLALETRGLPGWLPLLLALSGLVAVIGQGDDRFTAEALFLLLLLPYFLCGMAYIHITTRTWHIPLRRVWIACVYFVIFRIYWLMPVVIAIGLYQQLAEMLDRRKKIG